MKRRSFLAALFAAPAAAAVASTSESTSHSNQSVDDAPSSPFVLDESGMRLAVANIGPVHAGVLGYPCGSMIDLNSGRIFIKS